MAFFLRERYSKKGKRKEMMLNGLTQFRKDKPKHALYKSRCIKKDIEFVDPKTLVAMIATDQPFHKLGAGSTRNLGIKILHKQPANKIIAISEEPLQASNGSYKFHETRI